MATFDVLLELQVKTGEEIQRIITNFKKDSVGRKSNAAYYKEQLRQLNLYWDEYEDRDSKPRCQINQPMNHTYFTDQYDKIREIAELYIELFNTEIIRFEAQDASGFNAGANKLGPNQGASTTPVLQQHDAINTRPTIIPTGQHQGLIRKIAARMSASRRLLNALAATQDETVHFYKINISTINQLWNQLESLQDEALEKLEDPAGAGFNQTEFNDLGDLVRQQLIKLSIKEDQLQCSNTSLPTSVRGHSAHTALPLPKVTIPNFNGEYLKWQEFYNLFYQMIDKQPLPLVQKMWYLKSNVSGEAAKLISHLSLTEGNYNAAWTLLQDRYNNKRIQVGALIQKLLEQPLGTSTAVAVKNLHDTTREYLLALNNLGVETDSWDPLLLHMLIKKLDRPMHIRFEQSLARPRELLKTKEFLSFLELQFQSMESIGSKDKSSSTRATTRSFTTVATTQKNLNACKLCNISYHPLYFCKKFLILSAPERLNWIQKNKLCVNCFKQNHTAKECPSRSCTKCDKKHNSLVHLEGRGNAPIVKQPTPNNSVTKANDKKIAVTAAADNTMPVRKGYVLLATAKIKITAANGRSCEFRAILDSGSQINIISERLIRRLSIVPSDASLCIEGIGKAKNKATQRVSVMMQSLDSNFSAHVEAFVLPNIIPAQPNHNLEVSTCQIPTNIQLADPEFHQPEKVDILLGAEFYFKLMAAYSPTKYSSWVDRQDISDINFSLEEVVEQLWKMDEVDSNEEGLSPAEQRCEEHFSQNVRVNKENRFVVRLPFLQATSILGTSQEMAYNRFLSLERRLLKNDVLRNQYVQFMEEYERLGHMKKKKLDLVLTPRYFIPHHCVLKPDSTTTKLRVVFDASAKTTSGYSLNDLMYTGPTVQSELFPILLRFRWPRFVFNTDIEKIYRQILIHPEDHQYQVIMWRAHPTAPVSYYQLNTVTYGTRPAPYLATKCLQRIAKENVNNFPLGSQILQNNFYVDDGLGGSDSLITATEAQQQLIHILKNHGFNLRKWCANHPKLLQNIPQDDQEVNLDFNNTNNDSIKTLRLLWLPKTDDFCFKVRLDPIKVVTKRAISSDLARLFDPLGIVAPVIVAAKMFVQELLQLNLKN